MRHQDDERAPSRSARKRAAQAVEDLARRLTELPEADLRRLTIDAEILEEIRLVRSVPTLAARDRQVRHLAGVLRQREDELPAIDRFVAGLDFHRHEERVRFHRLEELRDRLCDPAASPQALEEAARIPGVDRALLARLARAAHGGDKRAFRELFRHLRRASEGG